MRCRGRGRCSGPRAAGGRARPPRGRRGAGDRLPARRHAVGAHHAGAQLEQGLAVALGEGVQQGPPGGVGQRLEQGVRVIHASDNRQAATSHVNRRRGRRTSPLRGLRRRGTAERRDEHRGDDLGLPLPHALVEQGPGEGRLVVVARRLPDDAPQRVGRADVLDGDDVLQREGRQRPRVAPSRSAATGFFSAQTRGGGGPSEGRVRGGRSSSGISAARRTASTHWRP